MDLKNNKYDDRIEPNWLGDEGCVYYDSKENTFRVNCGFWVSYYLKITYNTESKLINFLNKFLPYLKTDSKLIFDGAIEPDFVFLNLNETNILDNILNYILDNRLSNDSIQIWTADFGINHNTPLKYHTIIKSMAKFKNYPNKAFDVNILNTRLFDKKFFLLMNNPTEIRQYVYNFLQKNIELTYNMYYSYNSGGNNPNFKKLHMERYLNEPIDKMKFSKDGGFQLQLKSIIHIVSETLYWKNFETRMFSEKTFRPLNSCQPFILITHPYMLRKLKGAGFKTFDTWWDESYDLEEDDTIRIEKILNLLVHLNKKSITELTDMYNEMIPILKHNFNHLHSNELPYEFKKSMVFNELSETEQHIFL